MWMEKGREILSEDRWAYWDKMVPIRLNDVYEGMELESCLEIVKVLNNNGTLEEAKTLIDSQNHFDLSLTIVCTMLPKLYDRGTELVEYIKSVS